MLRWTAHFSRSAARRAKSAGDWGLAARHYRRALGLDPRRAATWVQFGNALRECGRASEAETAYRRSLELGDRDPDAHVQLGHLLKLQRRGDEAIAEYLRALELDPWLLHASQELIDLGWISHVERPDTRPPTHCAAAAETNPAPAVFIDASDLFLHFRHARLPTGIQRVQLHIIAGLLARPNRNFTLCLACFAPHTDFWVTVPDPLFATLAGLAMSGGDVEDTSWKEAVLALTRVLVHGDRIRFPAGAVLVNLGASWPHLNYFLKLRNAKASSGIRYMPFVHDCIPVLMPEHCVGETVRTYIDWLLGVFLHADGYLVNSKSTGSDLAKAAELLGHRISPPEVVPLDGWSSNADGKRRAKERQTSSSAQRRRSIKPFVLLVSTFEPRKNHMLAFTLWLKLIEKRGRRRTPPLVCVGHRGWKSEGAMSLLRSNKTLQRRVRILTSVADADLSELYQECLFTFYPSLYEGWGLPVTEALCHGKVPLISAVSSLPEAGGCFAEYFDPASLEDTLRRIERLIDDHEYRRTREALIKEKFTPRSWSAIADQIVEYARAEQTPAALAGQGNFGEIREAWAPPAELGRYYPIGRGRETGIRPGMVAGEMFRRGEGWWSPEEWGCWVKDGRAEIAFSLAQRGDRLCLLYLGLRGLPMGRTDFLLSIPTTGRMVSSTLQSGEYQWPMLSIELDETRGSLIRLHLTSQGSCDLAAVTGGTDRRVVKLGVVGLYLCTESTSGTLPDFIRSNAKP
jgi:glycosyltransferase involved in cell wall biosynthesis